MRDSGLDISYALRKEAIAEKRASGVKRPKRLPKWVPYERKADPAG
ncbi:hypothetical protein KCP77_01455 [Salmonella enterica subsp. enterica]|nr:hypothetical protein KCP77_01455 [Salmonella enterica subsp. enterica]